MLYMIAGAAISGCATSTPARPAGMVTQDLRMQRSHPYSVRIEAGGGRETDPKGSSQISNTAFSKALATSIRDAGLFADVVKGEGADFLLRVAIVELGQSAPRGFSMTAAMRAHWTLTLLATGKPVWADTIRSSHTASAISSRKAVTRMRLATEGAARKNIQQGMARIAALQLPR